MVILAIMVFERQVWAWIPSQTQISAVRPHYRSHLGGFERHIGRRGKLSMPRRAPNR